jgi:hypothetical protein
LPGSFLCSFMAVSFPVAFQPFPLVCLIASPYLRDLLPTLETPLWLHFQMFQFLFHSFGNPLPELFLLSFMAASFAAAFLSFPPVHLGTLPYLRDLVPTLGLRPLNPSVLPSVQPLGLIRLLPELPWIIHECIPIHPYCSSAFQALPSDL